MRLDNRSNWDAYYKQKEFKVPEHIVRVLWNAYAHVLAKHLDKDIASLVVVELGGADSCFYRRFIATFPVAAYHIIDNNQIGLDQFQHRQDPAVHLHHADLLGQVPLPEFQADVVFSAGLIEHFVPRDTRKIVQAHFAMTRPGGWVMMSFPTPTRLYWIFRRLLEKTGKFPPLYERPIVREEIIPILLDLGIPLEHYRLWSTILTQMITLTRKY